MNIKNAILLAGGDGTRFWPLQNKSYFPFLGKPLLYYQIGLIRTIAEKITVVTNEANIGQLKKDVPDIQVITQTNSNGMAGAVVSCKGKVSGEVLILNAEDTFDYRIFNGFLQTLSEKKSDYILLGRKTSDYFPGGYLKLNGTAISEIIEKPAPDNVPSDMIKLVADYISDFDALLQSLDEFKTEKDDWYEQGINAYLKDHKYGSFITYEGYWHALKFPWHVLALTKHFLQKIKENHIGSNAVISKTALIIPPVFIGNNVKIGDFSKIVGPAYIGDNSIIGDHTLIRESHLGNNVLAGGGTEVARSYLADGVMLHRNYVGDSVLDKKVLMGSGAVTANFRFDEKTVKSTVGDKKIDTQLLKLGAVIGKSSKIGVNTTLYPGVKIGQKSFISPAELVESDTADNIFVKKGENKPNLH